MGQQRKEVGLGAWNQYINRGYRISLRHFARVHNIPYETWRREFKRGAVSPTIRNGNRWIYAEYDVAKATSLSRVRRWFPKGTNFNDFTRREIQLLEDTINSIHRKSLNGETANAYDSRLASLH